MTRAFTARRVAALRPWVEQITHRLLDEFTAPVDLIEDFAYPLPITVTSLATGISCHEPCHGSALSITKVATELGGR